MIKGRGTVMEKIWEFFENMNELVYVSDMDKYEIIYMNKKALDTYGFNSSEDIHGKKCYEVLHGNSTPCSICNNCELEEGGFIEWRYYNPLLGKHFALKDTMVCEDGRRCRIELALDNSIQEQQSNMIRSYQNLEALANEGFRIALQASTPDKSLDVLLEYLGKSLRGERTYIFEKNRSGGDDNTYEWVASGVAPEKDNLQNLPPQICEQWYRVFDENRNIIIKDIEDIREKDPLQYDNLKRQDIRALVVVPLYDGNKVIGFYGVDNPPEVAIDYARNMLQIMAHFIISCIKRRELVKQLKVMSYSDKLTEFGNRFAMEEYINNINPDECMGIVYCDITGLKQVNDTQGHKAGDRLILNACASMKEAFEGWGLFRIGGDELLALCPKIEEDKFNDNIVKLRSNMHSNSVNMSVGSIWRDNISEGFDRLLSEAEKLMYEDKSQYYRNNGLDRRK